MSRWLNSTMKCDFILWLYSARF